jgi:hypothetical protein
MVYEIQSHQQIFYNTHQNISQFCNEKPGLNVINEYNSATRNQTYLISTTENKLVELPSDTSNLQCTYCRHTIGEHKSI